MAAMRRTLGALSLPLASYRNTPILANVNDILDVVDDQLVKSPASPLSALFTQHASPERCGCSGPHRVSRSSPSRGSL